MNRESLINLMVELKKISKKEAEKKIDQIYKVIRDNEQYENLSDEEIYKIAYVKLNAKFKTPDVVGDEFQGTVVGIGQKFDLNRHIVKECISRYEKDPEKAITEGYITLDPEGKPIALDYRTHIGSKDNPFENNNHGKPVLPNYIRPLYMIINGEYREVAQTKLENVVLGGEYTFVAKDQPRLFGSNFVEVDRITNDILWQELLGSDGVFPNECEITEVHDLEPFQIVLTAGFVEAAFPTKTGIGVVISDGSDLTGFVSVPELIEIASNLSTGMEVIILGKTRPNNKYGGNLLDVLGVFVNPDKDRQDALAREFDAVF